MKRRTFVRATLNGGALAVAAAAGLLTPVRVLAAHWPGQAFAAAAEPDVVRTLFGADPAAPSDAVTIHAPIYGSGDAVPIAVETRLDDVESIAVVVANNPHPLSSTIAITGSTRGFYSTRIKMLKTSPVTVYVKAGGRIYSATANVKISIGGYGMNYQ